MFRHQKMSIEKLLEGEYPVLFHLLPFAGYHLQ